MNRDRSRSRLIVAFVLVVFGLCLIAAVSGSSNNQVRAVESRDSVTMSRTEALPVAHRKVPLLRAVPSIAGNVHDAHGTGIPGASVCAACVYPECGLPGPPWTSCGVADERGEYALYHLAANRYRMSASANGYRPALAPVGFEPGSAVELGADAELNVDFLVGRDSIAITGVVVDVTGGPIAGASVVAMRDAPIARASTDELGQFAVSVAEGPLLLHVTADGYAWAYVQAHAPAAGTQVVLQPASSISGIVQSGVDGTPIDGLEVRATKILATTLTSGDGSTQSRPGGAFVLGGLSSGSYEITASGSGWSGRHETRVAIGVGAARAGIVVQVYPASFVSGRVVTAGTDEPCRSGMVMLSDAGSAKPRQVLGVIRANGNVSLDPVPAGDYHATVSCEGHVPAEPYSVLHVSDQPVRDIVWRVRRGGIIRGKVVDRAGKPVMGRRVVLAMDDSDAEISVPDSSTDESGNFRLVDLPSHRMRVAVAGELQSGVSVDLASRETVDVTLVVAQQGSIRVDVSARRPADLAVYAFNANQEWIGKDLAGHFRVEGLPPGKYDVVVTDNRNRPVRERVAVEGGRVSELRVRLPDATGEMRGRVLDGEGEPVRDAWIRLVPSGGEPHPRSETVVLLDLDGRFAVPNLRLDDRYDVEVLTSREGEAVSRITTGIDREVLMRL
jgi:hypothetical protein